MTRFRYYSPLTAFWLFIILFAIIGHTALQRLLEAVAQGMLRSDWPLYAIALTWLLPVYLYYGIELTVTRQEIRRRCLGLPFLGFRIALKDLTGIEKPDATLHRAQRNTACTLITPERRTSVQPDQLTLVSTDLPGFEHAGLLQIIAAYQSNSLPVNLVHAAPSASAPDFTPGKVICLGLLVIFAVVSMLLSFGSGMVQLAFSGFMSYSLLALLAATAVTFAVYKARPGDRIAYSLVVGLGFTFFANIGLHVYTGLTSTPQPISYRLTRAVYEDLLWEAENAEAPIIRTSALQPGLFNTGERKVVLLYHGPFGLVVARNSDYQKLK